MHINHVLNTFYKSKIRFFFVLVFLFYSADVLVKIIDYRDIISNYLNITQSAHAAQGGACTAYGGVEAGRAMPVQCNETSPWRFSIFLTALGIVQAQLVSLLGVFLIPFIGPIAVMPVLAASAVLFWAGVIALYPEIALCTSSFVTAPVMRDYNGNKIKCRNPEIITIDTKDENGNVIKTKEVVRCPKGIYDVTDDDTWPLYAVPGSDFVEVCVRRTMLFPLTQGKLFDNGLYKLFAGYGSKSMDYRLFFYGVLVAFSTYGVDRMQDVVLLATDPIDPKDGAVKYSKTIMTDWYKLSSQEVLYGTAAERSGWGDYHLILLLMNKMFFQTTDYTCYVSDNMRYNPSQEIPVSFPAINSKIKFSYNKDRKQMCASSHAGIFGKEYLIGCQIEGPEPPYPECKAASDKPLYDDNGQVYAYDNSVCYACVIDNSCMSFVDPSGSAKMILHSSWNLLAPVVGCFQGTLHNMVSPSNSRCNTENSDLTNQILYFYIQEQMQKIAFLVIAIAVSIFGYKLLFFMIQSKKDIMIFAFKLIFISYMVLGDGMIMIYDALLDISTYLVDSIVSAANTKICDFGGESSYPYFLSPWDKLDCRIGSFIGGLSNTSGVMGGITIAAAMGNPALGLALMAISGLIMQGSFAFALVMFFYIFFMLAYSIWATKIYMVAIVCLTILALVSPIFLLMGFFSYTKQWFSSWYKMLIGYAIYPTLIMAFVMIGFGIFDNLFFKDLPVSTSVESKGNVDTSIMPSGKINIYNYEIDPSDCREGNPNSMACILLGNSCGAISTIFGNYTICSNVFEFIKALPLMLELCIMIFLFYHFTNIVGDLAAELVGSFRSDLTDVAGSPHDTMKAALATGMRASHSAQQTIKRGAELGKAKYDAAKKDGMPSERKVGDPEKNPDSENRGKLTDDVEDMGEDLQKMFNENNSSGGDSEGTGGSDMDGRGNATNDDVAQRPTMQDRENLENRRDDE